MRTRLLVAVLAVMMGLVTLPAQAEEGVRLNKNGWSPSVGIDYLQPGYNLSGTSRQFHLTLVGGHVSLLKLGHFRFPTAGIDFQWRITNRTNTHETYATWTGHWLLTSGVAYVLHERAPSKAGPEVGIHAKYFYDTRQDIDPRIGRTGFVVGVYLGH